jgi:hypothetical protein
MERIMQFRTVKLSQLRTLWKEVGNPDCKEGEPDELASLRNTIQFHEGAGDQLELVVAETVLDKKVLQCQPNSLGIAKVSGTAGSGSQTPIV